MNNLLHKIRSSEKGTSLLEVLIALAITGVVTTAIMRLYVTQHKNYMAQDDITTVQQNARASIDELTKQLRMAGRDLPGPLEPIIGYNTNPDTIMITYRSDNCDTYLSAPMPQPSAELKCGTDISCFYNDQEVYIFDPITGTGEFFTITHVQTASFHIQHRDDRLSKKYDANAILLSMNQMKFWVDNTTNPDHPALMVQPVGKAPRIYAEDVNDLQFQYRLTNGTIVDEPLFASNVVEIIISVTARSKNPDHENPSNPYRFQTFTSSVNLRNLGS